MCTLPDQPLVALLSSGSRGDVEPFLALGAGLLEAGFRVRLASTEPWRPAAARLGLEFVACEARLSGLAERARELGGHDTGRPPWRWLPGLWRAVRAEGELLDHLIEDAERAAQGADAVVSSPIGFALPSLLVGRSTLLFWGLLQPLAPTRSFPIFLAPGWFSGPGWLNRRSYRWAAWIAWRLLAGSLRRRLGTRLSEGGAPADFRGFLKGLARARPRVLLGFSRALFAESARESAREDFAAGTITGHWRLEERGEEGPDRALEDFLAAGPPPLFVAFESLDPPRPALFAADFERALEALGARAVVRGAWPGEPSPRIFEVERADYGWLLPRTVGVIHHGGAGTIEAVLRAARPSLVLPGMFDQHFWARRLARAGAAPPPRRWERITRETLESDLRVVLSGRLEEAVARLARRVRGETGVETAVAAIRAELEGHASAVHASAGGEDGEPAP